MTDYTKLVEALRWNGTEYKGSTMDEEDKKMYLDAADAIEALQAQLPKRGEWVGVNPMVDTVQCSVCGWNLYSDELKTPYCPNCGADMRKMEVQDG